MLIDPKPLQAYDSLSTLGKSRFMRDFQLTLHDNTAYQSVLITCAQNQAWGFLKKFLRNPKARDVLWEVIDTLQGYAFRSNSVAGLMDCLPRKFRRNEGERALLHPVEIKDINLADAAFDRCAAPGEKLLTTVCQDYSYAPNEFCRRFITRSIVSAKVDWRTMFAFPKIADGFDVIARASQGANLSLYVIASAVMSKAEKRRLLNSVTSIDVLNLYLRHMQFSDDWKKHLNLEMRSLMFSSDIGL